MARDLFGEVPVYTYDIDAWLRAVPGIQPGSARAAHYVHAYDVVGKIQRAKLAGTFDATVNRRHKPDPFWLNRFEWSAGPR